VGAVVVTHVNQPARRDHELKSALENRLRLTDKGDYGAVGFDPGVDIEQLDTRNRCRRLRDLVVRFPSEMLGTHSTIFINFLQAIEC
jgi:hypothetical protein